MTSRWGILTLLMAAQTAANVDPHGRVALAAAFVITTLPNGMLFTLGVFLKPTEDAMGWTIAPSPGLAP